MKVFSFIAVWVVILAACLLLLSGCLLGAALLAVLGFSGVICPRFWVRFWRTSDRVLEALFKQSIN